jgi:hypothetical protein
VTNHHTTTTTTTTGAKDVRWKAVIAVDRNKWTVETQLHFHLLALLAFTF